MINWLINIGCELWRFSEEPAPLKARLHQEEVGRIRDIAKGRTVFGYAGEYRLHDEVDDGTVLGASYLVIDP